MIRVQKYLPLFFLSLTLFVPVTGFFAYGLIMCIALLFFVLLHLITPAILSLFGLEKGFFLYELILLMTMASLIDGIVANVFPVIRLSISLYFYLFALSPVLFHLFEDISGKNGKKTTYAFDTALVFALALLLCSACREVLAFNTLSLPGRTGLIFFTLPVSFTALRFFATAMGLFMFVGLVYWVAHVIGEREVKQ